MIRLQVGSDDILRYSHFVTFKWFIAMKTLIASTYQSFVDMCINGVVDGRNIHCTFPLMAYEVEDLKRLLIDCGGHEITITKLYKRFGLMSLKYNGFRLRYGIKSSLTKYTKKQRGNKCHMHKK